MTKKESFTAQSKIVRAEMAKGNIAKAREIAKRLLAQYPNEETAWLLMAAAADSGSSLSYARLARSLYPESKTLRRGLRRVLARDRKEISSTKPANRNPFFANLPRFFAMIAFVFVLFFAAVTPARIATSQGNDSFYDSHEAHSLAAIEAGDDAFLYFSISKETNSPAALPEHSALTSLLSPKFAEAKINARLITGPESLTAQKKFKPDIPAYIQNNERWIDVNLTTQTLTAFEGDQAVRSFTVSSGRASTPTVVGEFRIWIKVRIQDMSGPGYHLKDVPYVMFFYEDYGIHGTYWHDNFGTPMSAGCVNMTIDDSNWMYQFASVGTLVKVHY